MCESERRQRRTERRAWEQERRNRDWEEELLEWRVERVRREAGRRLFGLRQRAFEDERRLRETACAAAAAVSRA